MFSHLCTSGTKYVHTGNARKNVHQLLNGLRKRSLLPASFPEEAESERVMTVLREYVTNRGVALLAQSSSLRRPRSCFFSAERNTDTSVDAVWHFEDGQCVEMEAWS